MRNLKRVLSLSLASVMLFGMMVVGASAVQGYYDVDDEDNTEAIDILQQVEVMVGYPEDGGFHPDDPVTRAEMMVIMAKLLDLDYNYYAATCPFTDVPEWARGFVGAAYANKVAYGRGDGIFDPNSTVTPVEAAAFLMRALGYFQYSNDYADGFELATVKQGSSIGIFTGVSSSASEPMTRNQVAKMVLNTLESGMVQPDGNTINLTTPDGSVLTGKVNYVYVTSNKSFASAISTTQATAIGSTNDGYIVEMGEQLYNGNLKLYDGWIDDFGRPSRHWEYDGTSIGTYIKEPLLRQEYTTKVTGKDLYDLLGSEIVRDYKFNIFIDGEQDESILNHKSLSVYNDAKSAFFFEKKALNRSNTNQIGGTGNGVLTQVFVDGDNKEVYIAIINTYLAQAVADYNANRNQATFTIYNIQEVKDGTTTALVKESKIKSGSTNYTHTWNKTVSGEDFADFDISEIKADDVVLVQVAGDEIKVICTPEIVDEATVSAFKTDSYVVADGTQINYASTAMYKEDVLDDYVDTNMKDTIYRIYLDPYDYLIGIEILETEKQYVFLTGINGYNENLKDQTAIGNVVFLDGTSANVSINMKDSRNAQKNPFTTPIQGAYHRYNGDIVYLIRTDTRVSSLMNTWCTYSVDENGVYTLKEVPNDKGSFEDNNKKLGQSHMGGTYKASGNKNNPDSFYFNGKTDPTQARAVQYIGALGWDKTDGADDEYVKINKSNVSLDGIPDTDWVKVYGNNDSIYLTAETDLLTGARNTLSRVNAGTGPAIIITGASSVGVGVQDVDLLAKNAQAVVGSLDATERDTVKGTTTGLAYEDVSDGVYTLFNKNGYVIAAMVVGADDSANTSYAWVSSGNMNREGLVDGKWEYSRDVIIGGQKVTLTEIESGGTTDPDIKNDATTIKDPTFGNSANSRDEFSWWWEVKTKSDGTVKSVTRITADPIWNGTDSAHRYVYDINADTHKDTTILNQSFNMNAQNSKLTIDPKYIPWDTNGIDGIEGTNYAENPYPYKVRVTGNTLQVEGYTGKIRGFAVSPDATIAVVKDERVYRNDGSLSGYNYKGEIEYFTNNSNASGLTQAVNYLTDNTNFSGYIAAVLKDGRAECVIIYDKTGEEVNAGYIPTPDTATMVAREKPMGQITVYHLDTDTVTAAKVNAAVKAYLMNEQKLAVNQVSFVPDSSDPTKGEAIVTYTDGSADNKYYITLYPVTGGVNGTNWNGGKPWDVP